MSVSAPVQKSKLSKYEKQYHKIYQTIINAQSLDKVLPVIEKEILTFLKADRMTVYRKTFKGREIVSHFMSGNAPHMIRLPFSPTSIAGYVAMSRKSLRIDDIHDSKLLSGIHPSLRFDASVDKRTGYKTKSMIVSPIEYNNTFLGVLQIINRIENDTFSRVDHRNTDNLAMIIGQKFHEDFQMTESPYDYLVRQHLVTRETLKTYKRRAAHENTTVAKLLMDESGLAPEEVGESLEKYYQVPFASYDPDLTLPETLMHRLNNAYLIKNRWVPISGDRQKAIVMIDDPNDANRIMEIQQALNVLSLELRVGFAEDIERFLGVGTSEHLFQEQHTDLNHIVKELREEDMLHARHDSDLVSSSGENEAAIVKLVNGLILHAGKLNASDIHIEPSKEKQNAKVRMRIDGVCRHVLDIPAHHVRAVLSRIKIMSNLDIAERRRPQDGKITAKFRGKGLELRVATIPTVNGESAVLRLLSRDNAMSFTRLNMSQRNFTAVERLISLPHGIFLVVGPTGSGKTTTLHALLGHINTPERKIWTAEDPVEITQPGLQQVQVKPKIGFDFAAAMRSFLRADPDVILIGEMRDRETSHIGIEASLTGHLVFSTLHTNSAPETITRLLDLGIEPLNFADALLGILAQRLVRTLCNNCKKSYIASPEEIAHLENVYGPEQFKPLIADKPSVTLYRPGGCKQCGNIGYRGRTGIHELLLGTPAMRKLIASKSTVSRIHDLAVKEGMLTLKQDGIEKILKGQIDLRQLRKVTI